jgi:nitric oxide reductase subunit C
MANDDRIVWWASEDFWRKCAIIVTGGMAVVLIILTYDSLGSISVGTPRVPDYTVINHRIDYRLDENRNMQVPVVGPVVPLFGNVLDDEAARALVDLGKLTVQAKNCMNCHTILGNGAYYAPDLTKAWLDPAWGDEASRETLMLNFLTDPNRYARTYGTNRRMPNLGITDAEAHGVIAYLKWMSAIDTNGFPAGFVPIRQGD